MKKTALYEWHAAASARFGPFAGYDMPIQYAAGAVEEHRLTRRSIGFFDIDHMGQFLISGETASEGLSGLVSSRLLDLAPGFSRYALLMADTGGVRDDLIIYRLSENRWLVVANAANRESDLAYLSDRLGSAAVEDLSDELYMLSIQGPNAIKLMDLLTAGAVSPLPRLACRETTICGVPVRLGRTGYTGEDGVELFVQADKALEVWDGLLATAKRYSLEAGPVGLAARDSLRFEAGMPLYGHEIGLDITPLEAGLGWACDWAKDFVGKDQLLKQKAAELDRKLVTVNVTGGVPRQGYEVLAVASEPGTEAGPPIGLCVAGMYCPTVGSYSANAFVPLSYSEPGTALAVLIRGSPKDAITVKRPLYQPVYRR